MKLSSSRSAAYFVTIRSAAAFDAPYATPVSMRSFHVKSRCPILVPITTIFFAEPLRSSGRNALTECTTPRAFALNYVPSEH